nr:ALPV-026 [Albatrosspox virus]
MESDIIDKSNLYNIYTLKLQYGKNAFARSYNRIVKRKII